MCIASGVRRRIGSRSSDEDQGKSGQTAEGRPGFQRLLAEVALDRVGLILGLEMSRLARCCSDWHHLLDLCAAIIRCWLTPTACTIRPTTMIASCWGSAA